MKKIILFLITIYQRCLSPYLGANCRFDPVCSRYAMQAVERHGVIAGLWLGVKRICRCRPGGGAGFDPVPEATHGKQPLELGDGT